MIQIDGSFGEGGGQILRTALTLSLMTGASFRIRNIRAGRKKPGLAAQHLTAVRAAATIADARVEGLEKGSTRLKFQPGSIKPGEYRFEIGTAGSTSLLLHALYLPLCLASGPSKLTLRGGTHVPWSPTYEYLKLCWAPNLKQIGVNIKLKLKRAGFYPKGGGVLEIELAGGAKIQAVKWADPVQPLQLRGISLQAGLKSEVAERQMRGAAEHLAIRGIDCPIEIGELNAPSPGTAIALCSVSQRASACITALGERGKRAEVVGREAAQAFVDFLSSGAPIDPYAADQLILPLALAHGPSELLTAQSTLHLTTSAHIVAQFLPARLAIKPGARGGIHVSIEPGR